jgi:hypothetical protein
MFGDVSLFPSPPPVSRHEIWKYYDGKLIFIGRAISINMHGAILRPPTNHFSEQGSIRAKIVED